MLACLRNIPQKPEQRVRRAVLNDRPLFPSSNRLRSRTEQILELRLRQTNAFPERLDLVRCEQLLFGTDDCGRALHDRVHFTRRKVELAAFAAAALIFTGHRNSSPADTGFKSVVTARDRAATTWCAKFHAESRPSSAEPRDG